MVLCRVGIDYFPFFFGAAFFATGAFFAAAFFAGTFFVAAFAGAFLAAGVVFLAAVSRFGVASSRSAIGVSSWPMAAPSISTTSDHRRWYVETSEYGMT